MDQTWKSNISEASLGDPRSAAQPPATRNAWQSRKMPERPSPPSPGPRAKQYARNATIFVEGDHALFTYEVLEGAVRLLKIDSRGARRIVGIMLPGNVFGYSGDAEYPVTAEALIRCRLQPRLIVAQGTQEVPSAATRADALRRELTLAQSQLSLLEKQTAVERVAAFILMMRQRSHEKSDRGFPLWLSREEIADYLGLTTETVCRTFSRLRQDLVITVTGRKRLLVGNLGRLQQIASKD